MTGRAGTARLVRFRAAQEKIRLKPKSNEAGGALPTTTTLATANKKADTRSAFLGCGRLGLLNPGQQPAFAAVDRLHQVPHFAEG